MKLGYSQFNFTVLILWSRRIVWTTCALLLLNAISIVNAQQSEQSHAPNGSGEYQVCVACHGADGAGNEVLGAPSLAGSHVWYLQKQLENFKNGIRGSHSNDQFGKQMVGFAMALNEEQVVQLAKYIAAMMPIKPALTIEGDLRKGQQIYIVCGSCHGAKGQGNEALGSPRLTGLNDWYIVRQLQHFKSGVRGQHEADKQGLQMAKMAQLLADDQAIADVTAYINSLSNDLAL